MTPEKCPGCGAKLTPDMLACPNCPMSFPEDDGSPGSSNPLKQSRYYQFLLPLLFFSGLGMTIWWLATGLFHLGEEGANSPGLSLNNERPRGQPDAPAAGASAAAPAAGENAPADDAEPTAPAAVTVLSTVDSAPRPEKAVREWKLRGQVFDLVSLKPLGGCTLSFADEEANKHILTRTDSNGRYRVVVPSLPGRGYAVVLKKDGYAANYLDPGTEGVAAMDEARRREMAKDLAATFAASPAAIQGFSADPLITDFYLAPRR